MCARERENVFASEVDPFKWHFQWLKAFEDQQVVLEKFWADFADLEVPICNKNDILLLVFHATSLGLILTVQYKCSLLNQVAFISFLRPS